jgi:hypothetical protein
MGIKVTQLTKARLRWTMDAPKTGRYQALIDVYFHDKADALMVHEYIVDNGYYAIITANDPVVTIDGHKFKVHIDHAFSSNYTIALFLVDTVAGSLIGAEDLTLDLKAVIDYFRRSNLGIKDTGGNVINTPLISDNEYLTSINAGWEVNVGGKFTTTSFWTALQNEPDGTLGAPRERAEIERHPARERVRQPDEPALLVERRRVGVDRVRNEQTKEHGPGSHERECEPEGLLEEVASEALALHPGVHREPSQEHAGDRKPRKALER